MTLALRGVAKRFDDVVALEMIDLEARAGELLVIVGPSGSGKSTLLRCIAGLEAPEAGRIEVGGRDVTGDAPGDRDVAMVFQEYALYPHLDAASNIGFGLRARKESPEVIRQRVRDSSELLGLHDCLNRRPAQMSGGERQRVALARAIVREPAVFLMDEPLANLDAELRSRTRAEIRSLQRRLATTMLYVTHDQVEAFTLGDRVAVLRAGRIEQIGTPKELYEEPANTFVARFVGAPAMNLLPASLLDVPGAAEMIGIRPEKITLDAGAGRLQGEVSLVEATGASSIVHVKVESQTVLVVTEGWERLAVGDRVWLDFADADTYSFSSDGEALA